MQCEFPSCGQKVVVVSEKSSSGISTVLVPGWVSLPCISLLGLACMDPAWQVCAQNQFRFSPRMPASVCSKMSACAWATPACWGSAEEPWEQQPLCQGEGNALLRFCNSSMELGLPSGCLEVVLIIYLIPLFTSQTLLVGMCQESLRAGWEDQGTAPGSRGNIWPLLTYRCNFSGEELCKSWETPYLQALVGFSAFFSDCGFSSITICISGKAEAWQAQGFVVVFVFIIRQCCSIAWHKKTFLFKKLCEIKDKIFLWTSSLVSMPTLLFFSNPYAGSFHLFFLASSK